MFFNTALVARFLQDDLARHDDEFLLNLLMFKRLQKKDSKHRFYAERTRTYNESLSLEQRRQRRMAIPSAVLNEPSESQGMRILNSNNDQAIMITMTGFNCASFDYLLNKLANTSSCHDLY